MFHLDNNSGIDVMPIIRQTVSRLTKWFTEGDSQTPPSYPGADWFNIVQAELLNVLNDGGITPDKTQLNQLSKAIKSIIEKNPRFVKKSGDTMTGQLVFDNRSSIKFQYENNSEMMVRTAGDNFSFVFYDAGSKNWLNKFRYTYGGNSWRFENVDDVTINGKSILKTGDYGVGSQTGTTAQNLDEHLNSGFYGTNTSKIPDSPFPGGGSAASLLVLPTESPYWKVEQLSVVNGRMPRIYYRTDTKNDGKREWYEAITTANANQILPVGIPQPWPQSTLPVGWLECNGSVFNKNQFPKLAIAYPSGYLPDLRGEFIRGWDNGRGIDSGREVLSSQGDAIRNIHGEISPISESFATEPVATGVFKYVDKYSYNTPASVDGGRAGGVLFDASRVVPVSPENRPRNIAFMYIVKAE